MSTSTADGPTGDRPDKSRSRWLWLLGALAVAALVLLLGWLLARGARTGTTPQAAPTMPSTAAPGASASSSANTPSSPTNTASPSSGNTSPVATDATSAPAPAAAGSPSVPARPLPASVPVHGTGDTKVVAVPGPDSSRGGRRVTYTVEVEQGLGVPEDVFAATVQKVLQDPRGWEVRDGVHFVNVTPQQAAAGRESRIRIILGSPDYVDRHCLPLQTGGRLSCHARGKVLLNANRFLSGAESYGSDVENYRIYQISHEVGHSIGHGHAPCPGPGRPAPVMLQQTKSLYGCRAWPYPVPPRS